eukprot:7251715-Pyramimonas_sp.AAC.3
MSSSSGRSERSTSAQITIPRVSGPTRGKSVEGSHTILQGNNMQLFNISSQQNKDLWCAVAVLLRLGCKFKTAAKEHSENRQGIRALTIQIREHALLKLYKNISMVETSSARCTS